MEGGTEAFPELGRHCQHRDCNQLDFLPFKCDSCRKVFCLDHRSYRSHECPKSDHKNRKVIVCEVCSTSIETTGNDNEKLILEKHEKSGNCDPKKKKKPTCPVKRCREVLTFSNNCVCKNCKTKVCLKHRFPADHSCSERKGLVLERDGTGAGSKFLAAFGLRNVVAKAKDCAKESGNNRGSVSSPRAPSVKAF